jgi:hypothetical protein
MKVEYGQNIFDVCLQEFGDLELIFDELIIPNNLTLNSDLEADLELNLNAVGKGNQELKDFIKINRLSLNNNTIPGIEVVEPQVAIQWPVFVDLGEAIYLEKRIQVI